VHGNGGAVSRKARQAEHPTASKPLLLVFFYSPTSSRCQFLDGQLASVLEQPEFHEAFQLLRVDVDERPDLAKQLRIQALPTILAVTDRRIVGRIATPRALTLERELAALL
jgi:thioredoxin-like negative regulator of GroEL